MKKKEKIRSCFGAGLFALWLACTPIKGSLKEITKPYLGVYECKSILLAGKEFLTNDQRIALELKKNGVFTLYYKNVDEEAQTLEGKYRYDEKTHCIQFLWEDKNVFKQSFPIENGQIILQYQFGTCSYKAIFEQK